MSCINLKNEFDAGSMTEHSLKFTPDGAKTRSILKASGLHYEYSINGAVSSEEGTVSMQDVYEDAYRATEDLKWPTLISALDLDGKTPIFYRTCMGVER